MPYKDSAARRAYQNEWMQRRRVEWIDSQGGKCVFCGWNRELHVDHIDPASKSMDPSRIWGLTESKRIIELAKCQVLCRSCHEEKTAAQFEVTHPHGTLARYDKGCHCQLCRDEKARLQRTRRAAG